MKQIQSFALMMGLALTGTATFTACSSSDVGEDNENVVYDEKGNAGVNSEFVISIPRSVVGSTTRMSNAVTQINGTHEEFRGIDNIRLIPFAQEPTRTTPKLSSIIKLSSVRALDKPGEVNYKVYADQFVPVGTKNFLFYGKAIDNEPEAPITTMADKFHYGVLHATGLTDEEFSTPNDILFSLEQINTSSEAQANDPTGQAIITLLNSLANISVEGATAPHDKWSTTTNTVLHGLYRNFIGLTAASSSTTAAVLGKLHFAMDHVLNTDPARALANAIKAQIESVCTEAPQEGNPASLVAAYTGYPTNIGLPDGAARVRWSQTTSKFVDISANYGSSLRLKNTDYLYPAALWYYVDSPLKASGEKKSPEYDSEASWANVINNVYDGAAEEVGAGTRSVALSKAAESAVGRIETKIKMEAGVFLDGAGKPVNTGAGYTLKGILIGGQNSVGFDFKPTGSENMAIYDREIGTATTSIIATPDYTTPANQTLALETKRDQVVYAALELVNGGDAFTGFDGIIPTGATFYLAVKLDPLTAINYVSGVLDKIVQQDHVTKLTVTIKNGSTTVDRDGNGIPDVYVMDPNGVPTGVDIDGDGIVDPYDIDGDGNPDDFITDPAHGGPGWDTDGDGEVDLPVLPNSETGEYPDIPNIPDGLGGATNGVPDLTSPGIELGTSVNLEWQDGLILNPDI